MRIYCYMSLTCGAEEGLRVNISQALEMEGLQAEVQFYRINEMQAATLGLRGSPSVLIDEKDIQPEDVAGFS
ncbi:MAG TPA: hypothetical protein VFG06_04805 [Thermodesulfovibrionales bacterium]|nr:hypothetical protein [Thermodesulfovibrionales bacterium]